MSPDKVVYSDRLVRFVAVAPLLVSIVIAVVQLVNLTGSRSRVLLLIVLGAAMLAPNLQHLRALARAERPRAGGWTLAAMTVIYAIGIPLGDVSWLLMGVQLLVSTVIVLPRPWAVPAGFAAWIAIVVVSRLFFPQTNPFWAGLVPLERASACLVPAWFSAALVHLLAAREELATRAVLQERIRIDSEVAETVGTALDAIATRGTAISRLTGTETSPAQVGALVAGQLDALVDSSRQTLAETRRMIRRYQRGSLAAELDTAVALLNATGIRAKLVLPVGGLTEPADSTFAASLRLTVERLLHDGTVRSCRLVVVRSTTAGLQLLVDVDGSAEAERA